MRVANPNSLDTILTTNPRYAGAAFQKPETESAFIPIPNTGMVRIQQDAKLNADKAILAEQLETASAYYIDRLSNMACNISVRDFEKAKVGYKVALTAWREIVS